MLTLRGFGCGGRKENVVVQSTAWYVAVYFARCRAAVSAVAAPASENGHHLRESGYWNY